jgi:hypothetical protein
MLAVFVRAFGAICFAAFASIFIQAAGLYGAGGLLPLEDYVRTVRRGQHWHTPSALLWFGKDTFCDTGLSPYATFDVLCICGMVISSMVALTGHRSILCMILLYFLYSAVSDVGQTFLEFQWDILVLEVGFLAALVADPWEVKRGSLPAACSSNPRRSFSCYQPPRLATGCLRFCLFKLMIMSGAVKIQSGDACWTDLTALQVNCLAILLGCCYSAIFFCQSVPFCNAMHTDPNCVVHLPPPPAASQVRGHILLRR